MAVRHTALQELNFDRDAYSKDRPPGLWRARVDLAGHSRGSKTSRLQGGKRNGIHLYVEHENGQKIWLFVPLMPGFEPFAVAHKLNPDDEIEVEIETIKSGLSVVKKLRKI
jgi:hypothetical protein